MNKNNTKKRILVFSTAYYPFVGGAEVAIKEITDRLNSEFEFDLLTARLDSNLPKQEKIGSVNVYRLGSGNSFLDKVFLPFRGVFLIRKLNKEHKYYCMWTMMITYSTLSAYFFNILSGKKIPIVLTLQEGDSEEHLKFGKFGLISLSWRFVLKKTKTLTCISKFLLDKAIKSGYKGNSFLVPNGVDLDVFGKEVNKNIINQIKQKLQKKEEDIFLVTTGRLVSKNATDDIIRALEDLPLNVHLIIIGKGVEGYRLQGLAKDIGVAKRVKFLGFIDHKDIPKYLKACDIFVRPSRSEGFGNSFIEAMASGLPVVATPVGGIVDFVSDKHTGIFCSPDNPKSLAFSIRILLEDKRLRDSIVINGKELAFSKYGWDKISLQMKDVFDKAV